MSISQSTSTANTTPVTEMHNELCEDLDGTLCPIDFISTLCSADAQIFSGYRHFPSLWSPEILNTIEECAKGIAAQQEIEKGDGPHGAGTLLFTGCGTSGRIGFLTARRYRQIFKCEKSKPQDINSCGFRISYVHAGGDSALGLSDELPEDDPQLGVAEMKKKVLTSSLQQEHENSRPPFYVIGITCGISAAFVAGQIAAVLGQSGNNKNEKEKEKYLFEKCGAAVLGFNTVSNARNVKIENCWPDGESATCREIASALEERSKMEPNRFTLLNPIVGPEPVAGSSRMKGGTATLILLDVLCIRTLHYCPNLVKKFLMDPASADDNAGKTTSRRQQAALHHLTQISSLPELLSQYQTVHAVTYATMKQPAFTSILQSAVASLRYRHRATSSSTITSSTGNLYYLGVGSAGCNAIIDLSEMPDTYGAPFTQSRAFVHGGWTKVGNDEGNLSHLSPLHRISLHDFEADVLSQKCLNAVDTVIIVLSGTPSEEALKQLIHIVRSCQSIGANVRLIYACSSSGGGGGGKLNEESAKSLSSSSSSFQELKNIIANIEEGGRKKGDGAEESKNICQVFLPTNIAAADHEGFLDLSIKLMLNAISTYAQAAGRGVLFRGYMIAAAPANDKIYQRCVYLIRDQIGVSVEAAEEALIRAIYQIDPPDGNKSHQEEKVEVGKGEGDEDLRLHSLMQKKTRADHIRAALVPMDQRGKAQLVLPIAFLLAIPNGKWTVATAKKAVEEEIQVSALIKQAMKKKDQKGEGQASHIDENSHIVIGVDLGGTNVRAVGVSRSGRLVSSVVRTSLSQSDRTPASVLKTMTLTVEKVLEELSRNNSSSTVVVDAIAVGQPGHVSRSGDISRLAAFPSWGIEEVCPVGTHLDAYLEKWRENEAAAIKQEKNDPKEAKEGLQQKLLLHPSVKTWVFDDADSAVAGEVLFGAGRLARTVVVMTIGTGIGSGVALHCGEEFHHGSRGLIELGHIIVDMGPNARRCTCGQRGCLEMYASGTAIATQARASSAEAVFSDLDSPDSVKKQKAEAIIQEAAKALALGCLNAIRVYDPDCIVLCGGLAKLMLPRIRPELRQMLWNLHPCAAEVPISLASCTEPGAQGAAALAFKKLMMSNGTTGGSSCFYERHATLPDMDGLYNVCLKTGDAGADGTHLFSDPKLLGKIFVGPYVTLSPSFAFALIDDSQQQSLVSGYCLGVLDTKAFHAECDEKWWPALRREYPLSSEALSQFRDNEQEFIQEIIHRVAKGGEKNCNGSGAPYPLNDQQLKEYPSHMHIDLLPHAQGHGFGPVMVPRLLDALRGAGSVGVHLCMFASNERAYKFYVKLGFEIIVKGDVEWIMGKKLQ